MPETLRQPHPDENTIKSRNTRHRRPAKIWPWPSPPRQDRQDSVRQGPSSMRTVSRPEQSESSALEVAGVVHIDGTVCRTVSSRRSESRGASAWSAAIASAAVDWMVSARFHAWPARAARTRPGFGSRSRIRLRGTVTPDGRQPDRHLAGEPPADALAVEVRHVRSVRGSASLGRMSSVSGPPRRPAAATPASARRPGQDAAQGWHSREGAGRGRHAGQDAARGRHPGRDAARGRG